MTLTTTTTTLLTLALLASGPFQLVRAALGGGSAAVRPEASDAAAAVWSKFGLVVQKHVAGDGSAPPPHTTETAGIIMRAPDPQHQHQHPQQQHQLSVPRPSTTAVAPTALGKSWTQISVTQPPPRPSHGTPIRFTSSSTAAAVSASTTTSTSTTTARYPVVSSSTPGARREVPPPSSRYQPLIGTSKPVITITFPPPRVTPTARPAVEEVTSKRVRQYEDDEDDDDDDDDDDEDEYDVEDEDDEEVHQDKGEEEEIEEIVEVQHLDSDNYTEEKPAIVKKKRRRKKKKGKKHKPFKVKDFKKLRKFMLPLLLAYKLKFFTLVPLMLGGLVLIVATTGFAGFFFALFAVGLGLKGHH